jgi:hypothetical protein
MKQNYYNKMLNKKTKETKNNTWKQILKPLEVMIIRDYILYCNFLP